MFNLESEIYWTWNPQYIELGISELDDSKLPDLLKLKYNAINDAQQQLGDLSTIRDTFIGFQKYLYDYSSR